MWPPIPGHEAPVRACECELPQTGQEHGAVADAVCAKQSMNGATNVAQGNTGMSAPVNGKRAVQPRKIAPQTPLENLKTPPSKITCINSRCTECSADLSLET